MHLYIEGDVDGRTIQGQAYLGQGMRFGDFDPAAHSLVHWGAVDLEFADCNSASLHWHPDGIAGASYGAGSMPLARLTSIAGLACAFDSDLPLLDPGRYRGFLRETATTLHAAVDNSGTLWATGQVPPMDQFVGLPRYVVHAPRTAAAREVVAGFHENVALTAIDGRPAARTPLTFVEAPDGRLEGTGTVPTAGPFEFTQLDPTAFPLTGPFDTAELDGATFTFNGRLQFYELRGRVRFTGNGAFCIDTATVPCKVLGKIGAPEAGLAMFGFTANANETAYAGKGWLERSSSGAAAQLVLVAVGAGNSAPGLGLVATRE